MIFIFIFISYDSSISNSLNGRFIDNRGGLSFIFKSVYWVGFKFGIKFSSKQNIVSVLLSSKVNIPVIASGGAGSISDIKEVFNLTKATAAAAGSIFVYKGAQKGVLINYPNREDLDSINV